MSSITIIYLIPLYIFIILSIKRFHDINLSGWWAIVIFIPFMLVWPIFAQPKNHNNQFGEDPLLNKQNHNMPLCTKIIYFISTALVCFIIYYTTTISYQLDYYIKNSQKELPNMLNEVLKQNSITTDNKNIYINIELINMDKKHINIEKIRKVLRKNDIQVSCTDTSKRYFIDNNINIIYNYFDQSNEKVTSIKVNKLHCN